MRILAIAIIFWFNENLPVLFVLDTAFPLLQDWSSPEEQELTKALKHSPSAPSLLFLKVTSPPLNEDLMLIILSSILLPRETWPLPLCHRPWKSTGGLWRILAMDCHFLHLLAPWSRGLERLPHNEVKHIIPCVQPREVKHPHLTIPTILPLK